MATIQELMQAFYRAVSQDSPAAEERMSDVVEAVKAQETLLAAWFPATKQYFITKEYGQPCAVLFSERESFERFALACKERGRYVAAVENPVSERQALFAELRRCGFTRVLVDYEPLYMNLLLTDLCDMPEAEFPSACLNGKLRYLMQEIHAGTADGEQELEVLKELSRSEFLIPVIRQADGRVQLPFQTAPDGKRLAFLFTDGTEFAKVIQELPSSIVRFTEIKRLFAQGCDTVVINPGSGAELMLDSQLLETAGQAAADDFAGLELHSLREGEVQFTVTDPDHMPESMEQRITACLQNHPEVKRAWLRMLHKAESLLPAYLLITDSGKVTDMHKLYREIAEAVLPVAEGKSLECMPLDKTLSETLIGTAMPFYRKKRFGFLK